MTAVLHIETVSSSIAALNVSGVKICDLSEIPDSVDGRQPTIFPWPDGFVSDVTPVRQSTGTNGNEALDVSYTLNYRLCYSPVGSGRLFEKYQAMVVLAFDFMEAVLNNDTITGAVDLQINQVGSFGPVVDPGGNAFHGCDFALRILEFAV